MPCKYGCSCAKCHSKTASSQLFESPKFYGSQLGKYTGTINKMTAIERQGYATTTRFGNAINDKEGLISFLQRRELMRGNTGYYDAQIENLKSAIADLKRMQGCMQARNQSISDTITNNAGKMVPASIFDTEMGLPGQAPVAPSAVGDPPVATALPEQADSGTQAGAETADTGAGPDAPETADAGAGPDAPETADAGAGPDAPETADVGTDPPQGAQADVDLDGMSVAALRLYIQQNREKGPSVYYVKGKKPEVLASAKRLQADLNSLQQ